MWNSGLDFRGCAVAAACILLVVGAFLGWLVPLLWALVRPWIHAVTAG